MAEPTLLQQGRRINFLKKLQSLCGVVPLGIFFCFHLVANYTLTWSIPAYDAFSHFLETMPYKDLLEIVVIFLPLLFHAIIGIYIVFTGSNNVSTYGYMRNWRYLFQRITGVIAFAFLVWHVIGLKWAVSLMPDGGSTFSILQTAVANPVALVAFIIGVYSCLYHFVNGLWTFCITWGITLTPRSQQITSYLCLALFVVGAFFVGQMIFCMVTG
ncbi:succinate dehydrogenase [Anaerotardibacter muris]|uniref:succinate dehydrogenase n=1 Tax=Anaerotardibacter muris TaxID=2941505 RepID=UPI00203EC2C0|nr:succinate dehydrogenase [Anaerotardibacter muris]